MKKYFILLVLTLMTSLSTLAEQVTDSLEALLQSAQGKERIEILHALMPKFWLNYPPKAMTYGREALELANQLDDSVNISKSYRLIGGVFYFWGQYDTSLMYNGKAIDIALAINDSSLISNGYNNIGLLYFNLGNYESALEYLLQALSIKSKGSNLYGKTSTLNNIGLIFEKNESYETARSYYLDALALAKKSPDIDQKIYSNNNIGHTYLREGHPETAKVYFEKAIRLAKETNNANYEAVSLRGLSEIALIQNDLELADDLAAQSLSKSTKLNDRRGLAEVFLLLSKIELEKNNFKGATTLLDSSLVYADLIKSRELQVENYKTHIKIYERANDKPQLITYQKAYIKLRDSLYLDITNRNLSLVPAKLQESEEQIALTGQLAKLEQKEFVGRIYVILVLISIPIIALLILLLTKIRTSNLKLRINNDEILKKTKEIESQKEEIQKQNKQLTSSIKKLQRTQSLLSESEKLAAIGQLVGGLAHELNNPLNFIGGVIRPMKMNLEDFKNYSDQIGKSLAYKEMLTLLDGVEDGTSRASSIIDKLRAISPKLRTQEKEEFDLSNCMDEAIKQVEEEFNIKGVIKNLIKQSLEMRSNYYEVSKITHNLLGNALEAVEDNHAHDKKIFIEVLDLGDDVQIVVQDNGNGIPKNKLYKIFDPFYTSKGEKGSSGLGLFIAKTLIERNKGTIKVESDEGIGSTFIVTLPKQ